MSSNFSIEAGLIDWVTDALGLALVREGESGEAACNGAAEALLGAPTYRSLQHALERVLGEAARGRSLPDLVRLARSGERLELCGHDGSRILLCELPPGRAQLIVMRGSLAENTPQASRVAQAAAPRAIDHHADLAAGVSHELANALGAIAGWARLAQQGERVDEALTLIAKSAESAWQAARTMLDEVSGERRRTLEIIDLSAFVEDAAKLLGPKAATKLVTVRTRVAPGIRIRGERGATWSIVWNLAANAVEALSRGGTVELRLEARDERAVLTVEDDGPGMSSEQRSRAFEPYFTTKAAGTGLGLSLVKSAVGELGGDIELQSHAGLGTRFTVALPLASEPVLVRAPTLAPMPTSTPALAPTALASAPASTQRRADGQKRSSGVYYAETIQGRILVVDDDPSLREMIAAALAMRGADVVAVGSPEAALAERGPFALAVIDLRLPELPGDALAARLRAAKQVQRVLLITGMEPPEHYAPGAAPDAVLRKPFELEDLFEKLTALLAAPDDDRAAAG